LEEFFSYCRFSLGSRLQTAHMITKPIKKPIAIPATIPEKAITLINHLLSKLRGLADLGKRKNNLLIAKSPLFVH
jgi:hypothetical protein